MKATEQYFLLVLVQYYVVMSYYVTTYSCGFQKNWGIVKE